MAMNIISKEKKEIRWLGLPTNSIQEANGLELDKAKRIERIKAKTQQLQDLILQVITYALYFRNFQNVMLRLDFVEIWQFYRHSAFAWNQILANSNGPKMSFSAIFEVLNFDF